MKLLLDTHAFLRWDGAPARLSVQALALCQNPANRLLLSVASVWEMQIKLQLGKLRLAMPLPAIIDSQRRTNKIEILSAMLDHGPLSGLPGKAPKQGIATRSSRTLKDTISQARFGQGIQR